MNMNPAAASIAGTSRAAARGGETDNQATAATRQQAASDKPAGKSADAHVDAGDQTGDRGGDGRQALDVFERGAESEDQGAESEGQGAGQNKRQAANASPEGTGAHLDLEA